MRQFIAIQYGVNQSRVVHAHSVRRYQSRSYPRAMVMLNREDGGDKTLNGLWICQPTSTSIRVEEIGPSRRR